MVQGCPDPDGQTCSILYNACYGGFTYSRQALDEYHCRIRDPTMAEREPPPWDPIMIQMFREYGSEWMSGEYAKLKLATFPIAYVAHLTLEEYDGNESYRVDYVRYVLDEIRRIVADSQDESAEAIRTLLTVYREELKTMEEIVRDRIQAYSARS